MQKLQESVTNIVSKKARGERVREERKRLGYTQQAIADICGVHRVQWGRYERGEQGLDGDALRKFGDVGANIGYILTGQRNTSNAKLIGQIQPKTEKYTKEETELVSLFRKMSDEQKKAVTAMMGSFVDD